MIKIRVQVVDDEHWEALLNPQSEVVVQARCDNSLLDHYCSPGGFGAQKVGWKQKELNSHSFK